MFSPYAGFTERDIIGSFKVASATNAGMAMALSGSDASPLTPTAYVNNFGTVALASPALTITQSGTTPFAVTNVTNGRELGWLLQPVTANGPSLLSVLASVYDESVAAGNTAALVLSKAGCVITTDQYLATGTGKIAFDGSVTLGTICGINAGQPRVQQAGDAARLIFLGQATQRNLATAVFQIL